MPREIEVEISPDCNLRCPDCEAARRLHIAPSRKHPESRLPERLVRSVPEGARLLFVGLGEPALPDSQERIAYILHQRPDIRAFIQTNGTHPLSDALVSLVHNGRLGVGLSTDPHHAQGGQRLRIQPELVEGLSLCVTDTQETLQHAISLRGSFPALRRVLVDPRIVEGDIATCWEDIRRVLTALLSSYPEQCVYAQLFRHFAYSTPALQSYFENAEAELLHVRDGWFCAPEGFCVHIDEQTDGSTPRILTDGRVLEDLSRLNLSWNALDRDCLCTLEEYFAHQP